MKKIIKPLKDTFLSGKIETPSSKSMMQRVIAGALLCNDTIKILNASFCDDSLAAIQIAKDLGAIVDICEEKKVVKIKGIKEVNPINSTINAGEAGLSLRMFTPIASLSRKEIIFTGNGSLLKRPVTMMEKPLNNLGVSFKSNNGLLPITIKGPMLGGKTIVDGSISSQFLTGLLFALPKATNDTILEVKDLKSKPYIDMTIEVLNNFGINIENLDYKQINIKSNQEYKKENDFNIEGDWSNAAFLLTASAIGGENIEISNLNMNSTQADKVFLDVLKLAGVKFEIRESSLFFEKNTQQLTGFEFDATDCPDLFPPIVSLAVYCKGISIIKGISRLKYKESNRGEVLIKELSKLGIKIEISNDFMKIHGSNEVLGGKINSHNDHRIAMGATIIAIKAKNDITIENSECINKSYNNFYNDMKKIGLYVD